MFKIDVENLSNGVIEKDEDVRPDPGFYRGGIHWNISIPYPTRNRN